MKQIDRESWTVFEDHLFAKGYLVNHTGEDRQDCVRVLYALANVFGIKVTRDPHLAVWGMAATAQRVIGTQVPAPFYTGFPQSVLKLTEDQLLVDQMIHYAITYGLGDFSQAGHSVLEEKFERLAFREKTEIREYEIVQADEALELLKSDVKAMLASTRPLNRDMENLAVHFARLFPEEITECPCKDTAIRLLYETREIRYARFLRLPDVIRLADEINWLGDLPSPSEKKLEKTSAQRQALQDEKVRRAKAEYDLKRAAYQEYLSALSRYREEEEKFRTAMAEYEAKRTAWEKDREWRSSLFGSIVNLLTHEGAGPAAPTPPAAPSAPTPVPAPGRFICPSLPNKKQTKIRRSVNALNLRNRDRKLISSVIDFYFSGEDPDIRECYEKRHLWAGLLHHIHYQPKNDAAALFVQAMRGNGENRSVWSSFEAAMARGDIIGAADLLAAGKGPGAVARSLNYMLSGCRSESEIQALVSRLEGVNLTILIQMITQYRHYRKGARTFRFIRHHLLVTHQETPEETSARRSVIPDDVRETVEKSLDALLREKLAQRAIGKVYVEDGMQKIAVPIQEGSGSSGFGVLPRGSRVRIPEGDKLRCFTYWEKVNDIDLACFGLGDDGSWQEEFSWRTMSFRQDKCITFSGDETAGYYGGSEYFDIQIPLFCEKYPDIRYLVFTDNVYTGIGFDKVLCTAGYMIREEKDSGEVFEPKTVRSAFRVTPHSTYAVLFALDLQEREIVWLNLGMDNEETIAGDTEIATVREYLDTTDIFNLKILFRGMATGIADRPEDADVIVADHYTGELREGQKLIRSCDIEKIIEYLKEPGK